jgi:hypothetical protein
MWFNKFSLSISKGFAITAEPFIKGGKNVT